MNNNSQELSYEILCSIVDCLPSFVHDGKRYIWAIGDSDPGLVGQALFVFDDATGCPLPTPDFDELPDEVARYAEDF